MHITSKLKTDNRVFKTTLTTDRRSVKQTRVRVETTCRQTQCGTPCCSVDRRFKDGWQRMDAGCPDRMATFYVLWSTFQQLMIIG